MLSLSSWKKLDKFKHRYHDKVVHICLQRRQSVGQCILYIPIMLSSISITLLFTNHTSVIAGILYIGNQHYRFRYLSCWEVINFETRWRHITWVHWYVHVNNEATRHLYTGNTDDISIYSSDNVLSMLSILTQSEPRPPDITALREGASRRDK